MADKDHQLDTFNKTVSKLTFFFPGILFPLQNECCSLVQEILFSFFKEEKKLWNENE